MHARHGRSRPWTAWRPRPAADTSGRLGLQRQLVTGYLVLSAVAVKVLVLLEADRTLALVVIVAITLVVVGNLVVGWAWERLWVVTLVSIGVLVLASVVLAVPHVVLGFLVAVLAKACLDPVAARAGALCGAAMLGYLATVVGQGVAESWDASTWLVVLAPVVGVGVAVASLRLHVIALAGREDTVRRLEHAARCDPLTGAASRDHFVTCLADATTDLAPAVRPAVLMVDLDRFKEVNDTHGHRVGDELLRVVAHRLQHVVGVDGMVGRLGGDEFAILVPDTTSAHAVSLLARLRRSLAQPATLVGTTVHPDASIGLAIRGSGEEVSAAALMHRADLDMYVHKRRRHLLPDEVR